MHTLNISTDVIESEYLIKSLFNKSGHIPHQCYYSIKALMESCHRNDFVITFYDDVSCTLFSAFERMSEFVWKCSIPGYPFLYDGHVGVNSIHNFLNCLLAKLNAECIYFYNVYEDFQLFSKMSLVPGATVWSRLPSPIINWGLMGNDIWEQIVERYGRRAERQKKHFEDNLFVKEIKTSEIINTIRYIETNSWKHLAGQDLTSRGGELTYYFNIIRDNVANITFAFDRENTPVAYRIEAFTNNIVYVLKWSYNNAFKKYSPGFYLLAVDLINKWKDKELKYIDLFGSPDLLKKSLETSRLKRIDIGYPNSDIINQIRQERLTHDYKLQQNYNKERGLKSLYL